MPAWYGRGFADASGTRGVGRIPHMPSMPFRLLTCTCALLGTVATAQVVTDASPPSTPEPRVQRTVVEDDGVRVEELRVRGEVRRIVVQTKGERGSRYEVLPADGARNLAPGPGSTRGAAGQRVWNVLSF